MTSLPAAVIATVKATAPAVAAHGTAIVARMYDLMFAANPEVREMFNPAHMTPEGQIGALAEAVAAYAANIDRLEVLAPAVERISQKHASLGVRPEHYPVVGRHLLQAIRDVLGAAATADVIAAWATAYGFLADLFIGRERVAVVAQASAPGGWAGLRDFRVARKVAESATITSFYLDPADGGPLPAFRPGQYVGIRTDELVPAGAWRNYSLSDRPGAGHLRVSVKREPAAGAAHPAGVVSNHLHDRVGPGDVIRVSAPAGDFFLTEPTDRPVVLLSGGVGLTVMMSMLAHLAERGSAQPVHFIHAATHSVVHAFRDDVKALCARRSNFTSHVRYWRPTADCVPGRDYDSAGEVDVALVRAVAGTLDCDFYLCGPKPFMRGLHWGLTTAGVPVARIHFEFFGPASDITAQ